MIVAKVSKALIFMKNLRNLGSLETICSLMQRFEDKPLEKAISLVKL